jgi:hypothetical protein
MTIAGNLDTMQLADIVHWVSSGVHTGTLVVSSAGIEKSLYFKNGQIISCASSDPKEFLGHFLVSRGMITEQDLASAMARQDRHRELLGKILVDQGSISQADLERMLRLKAEEAIYELFRWSDGEFYFIENVLPGHDLVPISLDANGVILEGTRRKDEWRLIDEVIPDVACVPVAVADLLEGETDEARSAVLRLVDDDRSVEDICLQTHSSEFFVCEILLRKVGEGKVKVVRPRFHQQAEEPPVTSAEALLDGARQRLLEGEYEQVLRHLRAAGSLEPDNAGLIQSIREVENEIRAQFELEGVDPAAVPVIKRPLGELRSINVSPQEGFILSRITGEDDISSIEKISPLPELEARLVFWRLLKAGHIQLEVQGG